MKVPFDRRRPSWAALAVALLAVTGCADGHGAPPAGAGPSRPPAVASPSRTVPGMYLYRYADANGATVNDVLYRAPGGGGWRPVATVKGPATPTPPRLAVSPDHRLVAWILGGLLRVGALDGSRVTTVADGVGNPSCQAPTWTADSRRLLFVTTPPGGKPTTPRVLNTIQVVDADGTGRRMLGTTVEPTGCGDLASTDGDTVYALVRPGGKATLVAFDGGTAAGSAAERAVAATWPAGQQLQEVLAASTGVTRLLVTTVDSSATCCGTPADRYAVVDPGTGRVTGLDNANDTQASIAVSGAFTADGRVVLIADHYRAEGAGEFGRGSAGDHQEFLTVYAPDGTVLGGADLPSLGYGYLVGLDG